MPSVPLAIDQIAVSLARVGIMQHVVVAEPNSGHYRVLFDGPNGSVEVVIRRAGLGVWLLVDETAISYDSAAEAMIAALCRVGMTPKVEGFTIAPIVRVQSCAVPATCGD